MSLLVILGISVAAAFVWAHFHDAVMNPLIGREGAAPADEVITLAVTVASAVAFLIATFNNLFHLHLLSKLSERVVFVLLPPLALIFLVLGAIFIGVATPTEGGALGATVFSFTFNAADGHLWVEGLFAGLPGGKLSFIIAVNALVFILGCFIDFFEIACIVIPLLVEVAAKMDINLV